VESGGPSIRKGGEYDVERRSLQDCSSRLCRLRTDELVPMSKYWMYWPHTGDMGPPSLVAYRWWLCGFLHCFYGCEWKGNRVGTNRLINRPDEDVVGSLVSREQWLCPTLLVAHNRLLYTDYVRYIWSRAIHRLSMESVWCVDQVFPYRVYIDSNLRDSRIWVPLVYGSHHVDNLMNLI
jgi:hypothetical protein